MVQETTGAGEEFDFVFCLLVVIFGCLIEGLALVNVV